MNISSYNISDVGYHYIGLRVLGCLPSSARREEQQETISRSVRKYVSNKALRLLLPEPRGTFETIGERICRELVHFGFANSAKGAYELTGGGKEVLSLIDGRQHAELRRLMACVHLKTYDNLRAVVKRHLETGYIWRPTVEVRKLEQNGYLRKLLEPTFAEESDSIANAIQEVLRGEGAQRIEDALQERVITRLLPSVRIRVPLFRSIVDRLTSLRLLNIARDSNTVKECDFLKSYSPCVKDSPPHEWYVQLSVDPPCTSPWNIYFCEPDMTNRNTQQRLLAVVDQILENLSPQGGYYDLPEVRDLVCENLRIPEAAFDEGVNRLLDLRPAPLTMGLSYENISSRRKPLVRSRESSQIYNLLRRT